VISEPDLVKQSIVKNLDQLFVDNKGFIAYRLPGEEFATAMVSSLGFSKIDQILLHELPEGFLVKEFDPSVPFAWFLEPEKIISINHSGELTKEETRSPKLSNSSENPDSTLNPHHTKFRSVLSETESSDFNYEQKVELAVEAIKAGNFNKVVLARKKEIHLVDNPSPQELFLSLCSMYPLAFVYLLKWHDGIVWLGASPELLVQSDESLFRTQAIAGTRRLKNSQQAIDQTLWSQKEIEEQAMVSRYIIDCFKKIRVREYTDQGPYTVLAGDLLHLKTDFIVDKNEAQYPNIETSMLQLLHPTSAVCGMPKIQALNFIKQVEGFDRELYSGFLGPVNSGSSTHMYVNLRCAKLKEKKLTLFAGAGITQSSIPTSESNETISKMKTILNIFPSDRFKAN